MSPHVERLKTELEQRGHTVSRHDRHQDLPRADVCFLLSCERIVPHESLARADVALVCHPSDLPRGRGFSPLAWQIVEGANRIPVTLFEAVAKVDAGPIHGQGWIELDGHELNDEIKARQGEVTRRLCVDFVDRWPDVEGREQQGEPTWYPRRTAASSELDPEKSIAEQFDLLRVVDNERYPAHFRYRGHRYTLRIERDGAATPQSRRS